MIKNNYTVLPRDVETLQFDWGKIQITCSPEVNKAANFSAGVVEVQPGGGHDKHNHPGAEEIIYIISGKAEQMIEDENGYPMVFQVETGSTIFIPESRYHYTKNIGDEFLTTFVVYSPHGAEKLLKKMPDCKVFPAEQG